MEIAKIHGGNSLHGTVHVSGSKNSSLAILAATLLTSEPCIIDNVPDVSDICVVLQLLQSVGACVEYVTRNKIKICAKHINNSLPEDLFIKTRGAISIAGAMLARLGEADIFMPGGCSIGSRPIDLHLAGFQKLGFNVSQKNNKISITSSKNHNKNIFLGSKSGSTVTGTINMIFASCGIPGNTTIDGAACEPEILDLCNFLEKIGVILHGAGTPTVTVSGMQTLNGCEHKVIGDRIEAGTFICASLITKGEIKITGCEQNMLGSTINFLNNAGANITESKDCIHVETCKQLNGVEAITLPYPGFATDVQAQVLTTLTQAHGQSEITEIIYPKRFGHVSELNKMGANIQVHGATALIPGNTPLTGTDVFASDLRASASLYLAGLVARGTTIVHELQHLDRGYDRFEQKLKLLGADIERTNQ